MKPTTNDEQSITLEQIEQMIRGLETTFSQNDIEGIVAAFRTRRHGGEPNNRASL